MRLGANALNRINGETPSYQVRDSSYEVRVPGIDALQRLVKPLIVHRAGERREHAAEFPGVGREFVGFVGLDVLPALEHREMVRSVLLIRDIEAQVAALL